MAADDPAPEGAKAPVQIFVGAADVSKGYVWDVDEALLLRRSCRVQGAFVGGVSQYKNQNAIMGLPMELSADEVTFLLCHHQAELRAAVLHAAPLLPSSQDQQQQQPGPAAREAAAAAALTHTHNPRKRAHYRYSGEDEYYAYYEGVGAYEEGWDAAAIDRAARLPMMPVIRKARQQQTSDPGPGSAHGRAGMGPEAAAAAAATPAATAAADLYRDERGKEAAWKLPLQEGSAFAVPLTAAQARLQPGAGARLPPPAPASPDAPPPLCWPYPHTPDEWLRFAVYSDLHAKGYTLSCGAKFGADLLAYPGDPSEFHAQFTVRPIPPSTPLNPILLKSASRGSHTARKHLLLASAPALGTWLEGCRDPGPGLPPEGLQRRLSWLQSLTLPKVSYISIGPESGFGSRG